MRNGKADNGRVADINKNIIGLKEKLSNAKDMYSTKKFLYHLSIQERRLEEEREKISK